MDTTPDSPLLRQLALSVRAWRGRHRLTRRELAAASGLSLRFLADIENGTCNPSLRRIENLARALGIPAAT
ncbi:MAG: helix-turn-helix domain-containing protein, partial [Acidobacteria bacterium]|nr:helix-turn-helix domain-containing protein [Acidobacteriota bacterium]